MHILRLLSPFLRDPAADAGGGNGGGSGGNGGHEQGSGGGGGSFDFRTVIDEKGGFVEGWQDKLPADYDPYRKTLANFRDFGSFTKAFNDNMTAARAKTDGMLRIPGKDAKPEEVAAYRKALGVPEKPEEYELRAPEQMPEGVQWDQDFANGFVKTAHEIGLTKEQVQKLSAWHQQHEVGRAQSIQVDGGKVYEEELGKLRQTFGDNFEKRMIDVKRVAATLGLEEDHPVFWRADTVQALAKVADLVSEDKLVTTHQVGNKLSPASSARDIMTNKDNPDYAAYNDPSHGRHKEVVAFVTEQMKRAYPTK